MHLNYSHLWKRDQVIKTDDGVTLDKITHEGKEYVGLTVEEQILGAEGLVARETYLRRALSRYCPELDIDKFTMSVIPQLFLS